MRKLRPIAVLLATCLLLGSCALRILYPFLEWSALWSLDEYVSFTSNQRSQLKTDIGEVFAWHRYQELPRYAGELEALATIIQQPVSTEQIGYYSTAILQAWDRLMVVLTPMTVTALASLSDEQVEELLGNLAQREVKKRKKVARSTEAREQANRKRYMLRYLKRMAIEVNPQQEALIDTWKVNMLTPDTLALDISTAWREKLSTTLAQRHDPAYLQTQVQSLLVDNQQFWSDDYRHLVEHNQALTTQLITDIINSLTEPQRRAATARLTVWADDFHALSKTGTNSGPAK